ncbi:MAG TPA: DNRLRE domain-containing protein [Sedimentisphaerales bacterium]|nr:DNRLRE domain-containing protein [Sedimentisphaerales bacterium]
MGHSAPTSKLTFAVVFLVVFSVPTCAADVKDNLLLNSGAEQGKGDLPSFWSEAVIRADGLRMYRATDYVCSGKFSLAISNTHKYDQMVCNNWAQNLVDVPTGKGVRLSACIRTEDADSVNVCLQCWSLEDNMLAFASTPVVRGDQDWILLYSEPVAVPVGTVKITVRAVLTGLGKAWFDDLAVVTVDVPAAEDDQPETLPDIELAETVGGEIIEALPITRDCMILSYMPKWAHGNVDNIAVANNGGGVRTLLTWPEISCEEVADSNHLFLIALYSRKTTSKAPASKIAACEILKDWPEITSWEIQPLVGQKPAAEFDLVAGRGWKLFDITPLIRDQQKDKRKCYGLMLRFNQEDRSDSDRSGYAFVSREGLGQWFSRRPKLLIVRGKK